MQQGNYEDAEFLNELQQITNSIEPFIPANRFKLMLYNFIPPHQSAEMLQSNPMQPKSETSAEYYSVDSGLFSEALAKNPDPKHLYPWQINSCEQLAERNERNTRISDVFKECLIKNEEKLRKLDSEISGRTAERLTENTTAQRVLLEKLFRVRMKLERLLDVRGMLTRDPGLELKLRAKIDEVQLVLENCRRVERLSEVDCTSKPELKIPNEQAPDVLKVLREQRKQIVALQSIVSRGLESMAKVEAGLSRIYGK